MERAIVVVWRNGGQGTIVEIDEGDSWPEVCRELRIGMFQDDSVAVDCRPDSNPGYVRLLLEVGQRARFLAFPCGSDDWVIYNVLVCATMEEAKTEAESEKF